MAQKLDDVVVTVMDSVVSISFRDGSIDVPDHILDRSSLLRHTIETVDTSSFFSLPILKSAVASWLKCLRELNVVAFWPSEEPCMDIPDGETLLEYLKV